MQLDIGNVTVTLTAGADDLRVTICHLGSMMTFCLTAKEAKKLAHGLERFVKRENVTLSAH